MMCESRGNPSAVSWTGTSFGLFQLNSIHAGRCPGFWENWDDPAWNTACAYSLWVEQGWAPWDCQP